MASGSDGSGGLLSRLARQRSMAKLEAKRAALQEDIDELRDEIYSLEESYTYTDNYETVLASKRAALDKLEAKRDALQEDIDAL